MVWWTDVAKPSAATILFREEVVAVALPRNDLGSSSPDLTRSDRNAETARLFDELATRCSRLRRQEAQERVVCINMGVARDVAHRYEGRGVAVDDLHQVAYLGLVKAVRRFDPARGTDFLGYAVPTVRGEIRRWFRDAGWMVRPPRSIQELQARITRARSELAHELGRPPELSEIAAHLAEDQGAVGRAMAANGCFSPSSLDAEEDDDDQGTALAQRLGGADPGYARVEARVALTPLVRGLDDREQLMLHMRFVDGATQREIGAALGVTQTQVSRLMSALLARLRGELEGVPGAA